MVKRDAVDGLVGTHGGAAKNGDGADHEAATCEWWEARTMGGVRAAVHARGSRDDGRLPHGAPKR
ncbi:hypothetical protein GCM10008174_15590 [Methylopila turkensis]|uniref:Uncharacterized protein n=1 Tax=Methylopila turkensis TaxID=1437816 RepID=A0A9W6JP51_9HYPH|nr:hypothetical protein GCM10008174_15590 [Methylopila turkensis]